MPYVICTYGTVLGVHRRSLSHLLIFQAMYVLIVFTSHMTVSINIIIFIFFYYC